MRFIRISFRPVDETVFAGPAARTKGNPDASPISGAFFDERKKIPSRSARRKEELRIRIES
jgi:hypothetical protein